MNTYTERHPLEADAASKQWFKDIAPVLFLVDVGLMFSAMIFNNVAAIWVFVLFQIVVTSYAISVLCLAYRAARVIPASIPLQRPFGVILYISAHLLQFAFPGQLPLALAGYVLIAVPISIVFLFVE
jgi:hypothetical protein